MVNRRVQVKSKTTVKLYILYGKTKTTDVKTESTNPNSLGRRDLISLMTGIRLTDSRTLFTLKDDRWRTEPRKRYCYNYNQYRPRVQKIRRHRPNATPVVVLLLSTSKLENIHLVRGTDKCVLPDIKNILIVITTLILKGNYRFFYSFFIVIIIIYSIQQSPELEPKNLVPKF